MFSVGGCWPPDVACQHSINVTEALAVVEALLAFREHLEGASVLLKVDNTSVGWTIKRGYARAKYLNTVVNRVNEVNHFCFLFNPLGASASK